MIDIVRRDVPAAAAAALAAAGVPPVLARVYAARGIATPAELDAGARALPPPSRRCRASTRRRRGSPTRSPRASASSSSPTTTPTAPPRCAVGVRGLAALGADVDFLVPNRFEYGYGLTPEIVDAGARATAPRLLVTVDNGIASHDGVAAAAARGIDVLVTDHHLPAATLPAPGAASSIRTSPGARFRRKHLAGVGVMFYVLLATRARAAPARRLRRRPRSRTSPRCSTWSRSAPSPTSCASIASTARWSRRGSRASARAARSPASPRCSPPPVATRARATRLRPRLRRRAAAQRRRPARRHDARHPLPARRRRARRRCRSRPSSTG